MKSLLIITTILLWTNVQGFSSDFQDTVKVDKKKLEEVIKKRPELKSTFIKDFDVKKVTFSYPKKYLPGENLSINVLWKEEVILMYEINPETYELTGEIIDLR